MSIPILIPAAGASSRMRGADKLMMQVGGTPLLRRQIDIARAVSADVRVGLPPAPHARYDVVPAGVPIIAVPDAAEGMSRSVRTLVHSVKAQAAQAMILLADLPALDPQDLQTVIDAAHQNPDALIWRGTTQDGVPGHPMIISSALFDAFSTLSGDAGGGSIAKSLKDKTVFVPLPDTRACLDLDTPEAWAAWHALSPQ